MKVTQKQYGRLQVIGKGSKTKNITKGPNRTTADDIHDLIPDVKILVVVRDPTERLYSEYNYFLRKNETSAQDFHDRVVATIEQHKSCRKINSVLTCAYLVHPYNYTLQDVVGLHLGMYDVFIGDWLKVFKKELFVSRLEDFTRNPVKQVNKIFSFLELPHMDEINHGNANKNTNSIPRMMNKTREMLDEFYKPHKERLAQILKDDRFLWKET